MTIFEFSKTLPPPIAYRFFIAIFGENDRNIIERLTNNDSGNCYSILGGAFCWANTEEGHDYWSEIYRGLKP